MIMSEASVDQHGCVYCHDSVLISAGGLVQKVDNIRRKGFC